VFVPPLPSPAQAKSGPSSKAGKSVKATKAKKRSHSSISMATAIAAAAGPEAHTTRALSMAGDEVEGTPSKVGPFCFVSVLCCMYGDGARRLDVP
jgi:hypothetical protein